MNKPPIFLFLIMCFVCILQSESFANDQKESPKLYFDLGGQGGWVPYRKAAVTGADSVFKELSDAMEKYSGIEFLTVNLPQKRAEKALIVGIVDFDFACLEWLSDNKPGEGFVATEPLFEISEYLVTLKQNTHMFPYRQSIFGKQVGTIAGYFYFDDRNFIRSDFLDENLLMQGLKHDRFKVIILERETAKHWAKINNTEIGFAALHTKGNLVMRLRKSL